MTGFVTHRALGDAHSFPEPRNGRGADLVRRTQVVRQAIYDASGAVVSYQLLFRTPEDEHAHGEQGTSQLIASTFGTFDIESIAAGRPVFVNFTRAFITGILPIPLGPGEVVIEIDESMVPDHELVLGLRDLVERGYRIALSGYRGDVGHGVLLDLADFVAIDVTSTPTAMLAALADQVRDCGATMIATGITDATEQQRCQNMGFELFQGPFLQRPKLIEGRTLSPIQLVCIRLLNLLSDEESPTPAIAQLVGSDPGLSMRLLRSANAVSSGVRHEITSLRHAIVLLGPRRMRAWVVLTVLEGGATRGGTDELWSVLARALACQKLARQEPDVAYTVGLLSGCAHLLGQKLDAVAAGSGLGARATSALLDGEGDAGAALRAVIAHEDDDMDALIATGLMPFDVSHAYLEALSESLAIVHGLSEH